MNPAWRGVFSTTLAALLSMAPSAFAQQPAGKAGTTAHAALAEGTTLESDPIRCWLKTTKTAVHIGEQFNLALTCAVIETSRVAVIPDLGNVEPATIQLAPFEVVGGVRHADIRAGMWRYLQFEYTLRLIADSFFGQDLAIPPVSIKYVVQVSDAGMAQQGHEKSYVLPVMPMRVISLVPQDADDIRDASRATFADIEARELRGAVAYAVGVLSLSFAALLLLLGIVRIFRRRVGRRPATQPQLSPAAIAAGCVRSLRGVSSTSAGGWTADLVGEALSTLRIAAALAVQAPVTQQLAAADVVPREGQLALRRGLLRPHKILLSTPVTSLYVTRLPASSLQGIRPLQEALGTFTDARYGRDQEPDGAALSVHVGASIEVLEALRWRLAWPVQITTSLLESITARWRLVWAR